MTHVQGERWAGMPQDDSGRPGRLEMIIVWMTALLCFTVGGWVGSMGWDYFRSSPTPAMSVSVQDGRGSSQRLITLGAYWSWSVTNACGQGPTECEHAVRDANREAVRYGLRVTQDGSVSPL